MIKEEDLDKEEARGLTFATGELRRQGLAVNSQASLVTPFPCCCTGWKGVRVCGSLIHHPLSFRITLSLYVGHIELPGGISFKKIFHRWKKIF